MRRRRCGPWRCARRGGWWRACCTRAGGSSTYVCCPVLVLGFLFVRQRPTRRPTPQNQQTNPTLKQNKQRYHAETKRADAPPHTYETAEAHALALLAFLQSFRLPDWALPRAADVPAAALLGGSDATASLLLVPEWVDPERQGPPPPPLGHREPPALGHEDEAAAEDDEEDDDGDYHALQRGAAHPLPAHVFLLAPQVLRGCMGGGASSVVRAAALALLAGADLGGTFLRMRREVDRHRRALDDAGLEIAELRDQTARLSVSSVAGFF